MTKMMKLGLLLFVTVFLMPMLHAKVIAAEDPITCKLQHGVPPGQTGLVKMTEVFGSFLEQESKGKIKVKYFAGDAIVPTVQVWDGANSGAVDIVTACTCYTIGKSFASAYFCNAPGSLSLWAKMLWYYEGGGYELAKKLLLKHYKNTVIFPGGWMMTEPWFYTKKEITGLESLKGMKVRASGVRAKVYSKIGMASMGMAQGEIMPAMDRGVIDAFELATFWSDMALGTTDVSKYVYIADKYVEGGVSWVVVNKGWFDKLSPDLQKAVERASLLSMHHNASLIAYMEAKALHDAEKTGKIKVRVLPDEIQVALFKAAMEVISDAIKAGDKEVEELWKSQWSFYQQWRPTIKAAGHVGIWNYMEDLVPADLKSVK